MRLPLHGRIGAGLPANLVIFRGRCYSELLSRPQYDRVGAASSGQPAVHHTHARTLNPLPVIIFQYSLQAQVLWRLAPPLPVIIILNHLLFP